ncbi:hypothetical protein ACLB2K_000500 [Fragaria x ananassa]
MPYDGAVGGFRLRWDVFLSFRGEDTSHTITNSLYDALVQRDVHVFRDDDALNRGDENAPSLLEAIDDSAAAVVVVDPSDVRRQSGPFEKDFRSHEMRFESSKVCAWRKAMAKVGGIAGARQGARQGSAGLDRGLGRARQGLGRALQGSTGG